MSGRRRWLLDLTVSGQVLRLASSPVVVTDRAGDDYVYSEGLELDSVSVLATSVALSLSAPPHGPTWAQRISRGQEYEQSAGVLRLHVDGELLEDAQVILRGSVTGATFGGAGDPLRFSLATVAAGRGGLVPRAESIVRDNVTWPRGAANTLNEPDEGRYYPVVFGRPGLGPDGDTYPCYRVPLVLIDSSSGRDYWVIGDGEIKATASGIELFKIDTSATPTQTAQAFDDVTQYDDALGHQTTCARTTTAAADPTQGAEYYCGHTATGGGLWRRDRTGAVRGAGEVIERLLQDYSSIPVDAGRMRAVASRLDAYKLDGYIDEPIAVWEYIERAILPLLPVAVRWSASGLYLTHMDYAPDATSVVAYLDTDREDVQRTSVASARFDLYNQYTVRFGHDREGLQFWRILTGDPDANAEQFPGQIASPWTIGDLYCLRSQSRYGILEHDPIETGCVWDAATAALIMRHLARKHALPIWGVQYVCGNEWRHLQPGDVVQLTDSDLAFSERLAVVEDVAHGLGETILELSVVPSLGG